MEPAAIQLLRQVPAGGHCHVTHEPLPLPAGYATGLLLRSKRTQAAVGAVRALGPKHRLQPRAWKALSGVVRCSTGYFLTSRPVITC